MTAATPIADMRSGTEELSVALQATLRTPAVLTSLSDADSRSRAYLQGRAGGMNLQTWAAVTDTPPAPLPHARQRATRSPAPPHRDDRKRLHPAFTEWMMAPPRRKLPHGPHGSGSPATRS